MSTVKEALDKANAGELPHILNKVKLGTALRMPEVVIRTRSGLTSQAAHVHDVPGLIASVNSTAGTPLAIVHGSAPDAGEVRIEYTANVATLTFEGAVTGYTCSQLACAEDLAAALDAQWTGTT